MNEITIEIRDKSVSIQGDNIQDNPEQVKQILQNALDALKGEPAETHKNEITFAR